jgi:hypothetical protein
MNREELAIVTTFITTLGYYQSFSAVEDWFDWDSETINTNMKIALAKSNEDYEKGIRENVMGN